jgi:3-phosphoshikimate 1-carboxyvinyltransferase
MTKSTDMNIIVQKTLSLSGKATLPSSKSQNIRGLFFALLAKGVSVLTNALESEDTRDALTVCQHLGADITQQNDEMIISSQGLPLQNKVNALNTGNSGITTRFALPLLGFRKNYSDPIIFDCKEQMRQRPIQTLVDALTKLGMHIEYLQKTGACPLRVSGRLLGGKTSVNGLSSQYLSALLIALPCAPNDSEIRVVDLHERPYAEITLHWLREQGIKYQHHISAHEDIFTIPGNQRYSSFHKTLTGDFSSASYLIAAGALLKGQIELKGLDRHDPQGDKRLLEILQNMGADIVMEDQRLIINGGKPLHGIEIDANDIPDLLPTLAVIGTAASGKTLIRHVQQARIKETDRIHSMTQGLTRLGAHIEEYPDGMCVYQSQLKGTDVEGFDDHRTVMALTLAGMIADGQTRISDAQAVSKTFPGFFSMMQSLGAHLAGFPHEN